MDFFEIMLQETLSGEGGGDEPTGTIDIVQNGVTNVKSYANANVQVPNSYGVEDEGKVVSSGALVSQTSTSTSTNGTLDTTLFDSVVVTVPNSYTVSDEGKVVDNGALVAQGSQTITKNGTYDTTLNDEVTVDVQGGVVENNFLFHFNGGYQNSGETNCIFRDITGLSISDEQSKFGSKSLKTGTTQVRDNTIVEQGFELGGSDFTLDFWVYPTSLAESGTIKQVPISFNYRSLAVYINQISVNLSVAKNSTAWVIDQTASANIPNNQWHHIAVVRNSTLIYLFINGVKIITVEIGNDAIANTGNMTVGSNTYSNGDRRFKGYIDELRLIKGQAVWTDDFTPPTEPYPSVKLITKTITKDGTYNASDDDVYGYSQVTVNVSGGGSGADFEIDFTSLGTKTYHGVYFDSNGAIFNSTSNYILVNTDICGMFLDTTNGVTFEVDIDMMQLTSGSHRRFLMPESSKGFIYRSTGVWSFYNSNWEDANFEGASNGSFFDDCTVKVYIDASNHWHIYKDGVLVWEPSLTLAFDGIYIGSTSNSINNAVVKAIRFYDGQH